MGKQKSVPIKSLFLLKLKDILEGLSSKIRWEESRCKIWKGEVKLPLFVTDWTRSFGEGNGIPLQYCLENPMDQGAWWAAVHGVAKGRTRLSDFTFTFQFSLSCIGEGNGNPLQCSWLENPRDGGAWWAAVYGVAQSRTRLKQLSSSKTRRLDSITDSKDMSLSKLWELVEDRGA